MPDAYATGSTGSTGSGRRFAATLRLTARQRWVRHLARAGFLAKCVVYLVMGLLALSLALGAGGALTDSRGALTAVSRAPLGRFAVLVLAVSLCGLALWFAVDGLLDPDRLRTGKGGPILRLGQVIGALGYVGLAIWAFGLFAGDVHADETTDQLTKSWTGHALALPGGPVLVFLVGAVIAAVGLRQARVGIRREFLKPLDLRGTPAALRRAAIGTGVAGFLTQGLVFALVGLFFVQAAVEEEAWEATGFDGALAVLARGPHGALLLSIVSIGLLAYAAFAAIEGTFRRYGR